MTKYYSLIKNNIIDFDKLLLEKYSLLRLEEAEVIILIKLNKVLSSNKKFNIKQLSNSMTMSEEVIREKLVKLINNQFITLQLVNNNEIYSLDDTYNKLCDLLENDEIENKKSQINNEITKVVQLLEKEFKKVLSPLELELVQNWINEDKYTYDKIYNAVLDTLKANKKNIQYVDMILNKKTPENKTKPNDGLKNIFNQVYEQIK